MPLTYQQQRAVEVLDWLLDPGDDSRRSGRTFVMAVAFIRVALQNPGTPVAVRDHHPTRDADRFLIHAIETLIHNDPLAHEFVVFRHDQTLVHTGQRAFPEWLPADLPDAVQVQTYPRHRIRSQTSEHSPPLTITLTAWDRLRDDLDPFEEPP